MAARKLTYHLSMQPLTPTQLLDCTEGRPRFCESGYCDVWLISASVDTSGREILGSLLSADERARANRFRFEEDRARLIVARGGLRRILSSYCSVPPHSIEFQTGSHGKPALLKPSVELEFNISHSGDYVIIAVTSGVACGVDIEWRRASTEEAAIAASFFCDREVEWLSRIEAGFLRLWTAKEAVIKAVGRGLSIPLCEFDLTDVVEGKTSRITLSTPGTKPQTLWLKELSLVPNYVAAIATIEEERIIRMVPDPTSQRLLQYSGESDSDGSRE